MTSNSTAVPTAIVRVPSAMTVRVERVGRAVGARDLAQPARGVEAVDGTTRVHAHWSTPRSAPMRSRRGRLTARSC